MDQAGLPHWLLGSMQWETVHTPVHHKPASVDWLFCVYKGAINLN